MALPDFPIDEAYLIGGWLASFFWGLYTLLFCMTLYSVHEKRRGGVNRFTTGSIVILYILATTHVSLVLVRLIQGFVLQRDTIGPVFYFVDIGEHVNVAKDYIYITILAIGDSVIVWRLYVVWGRNIRVAVFPMVMIVGELIAGYGAISMSLLPNPNPDTQANWGTGMYVMSMTTNIIVTGAVAVRIWYMTTQTRQVMGEYDSGRYNRAILLIVESGALIAASKVIEFTLFELSPTGGPDGLNAMYIVYEIIPQITGLAPTAIVYAVNNGFTQKDSLYSAKSTIAFNAPHHSTLSSSTQDNSSLSTTGFFANDHIQGAKHIKGDPAFELTAKVPRGAVPPSSLEFTV
ncbi:hypothetical protein BD309DRAFT_1048105 [Dichomitus squalens]|uniref:Integral membrane protein n=1 Tax=Dichomitus squalens TaxID=114155 RepID=A0A4V2K5F0_9APHY|nr:hypothetical protein BD311DRAFT_792156 [Dichomitus squalens]TBU48023.1 hypothetical protein BD309DRAFT_1048105 [Dichomitus squalens]TBU59423.1 hypothetical protein BD310DRAFT_414860 [Dichomitus squalens]